MGDAPVEQPSVHLLVAPEPQARREEALPNQADLVLDLPLLPSRRWCASGRFDQVMRTHLDKAPIEAALLTDEHGLERGLHVVVDAARAGAAENREAAVMGIEDPQRIRCAWLSRG